MKHWLFGTSILVGFLAFAGGLPQGPADESAYWILKHPGVLKPFTVVNTVGLNFGQVEVGLEKYKKIRITNKGYGDLKILKMYLQKGKHFAIKATTCTKPLEMGQSCEITLLFKPTSPGNHSDFLYITTNDPARKFITIKLQGYGAAAMVELPVKIPPAETVQPKKENLTFQPKVVEKLNQPSKVKVVEKKFIPKKKEEVLPKYRVWTVKPCDTLWDISTTVYGTPLLWAAIYEANKNLIRDPWILKVGEKLKIPVLTKKEIQKYRKETLQLMKEMADRPLGPKCP